MPGWAIALIAGYAVVGFTSGAIAASREYSDWGDTGDAGCVGLYMLFFWPAVLLILLFGAIARGVDRGPRF